MAEARSTPYCFGIFSRGLIHWLSPRHGLHIPRRRKPEQNWGEPRRIGYSRVPEGSFDTNRFILFSGVIGAKSPTFSHFPSNVDNPFLAYVKYGVGETRPWLRGSHNNRQLPSREHDAPACFRKSGEMRALGHAKTFRIYQSTLADPAPKPQDCIDQTLYIMKRLLHIFCTGGRLNLQY